MNINISINRISADLATEVYLKNNSYELEMKLLDVIHDFIGRNVSIEYKQEFAQIDVATGNIVDDNYYPINYQYNERHDIEYEPLSITFPTVFKR